MKNEKGITLLALVVTIIIILILSGIAIGALTGDNGLIGNAISAKEKSEIDNEKEILNISVTQAMGKNKYGNLETDELQYFLDQKTENEEIVAYENDDNILVQFKEKDRWYSVDENGNIAQTDKPIFDDTPGVLSGIGTIDDPFVIMSIEDLVVFSNMVNGEGIKFNNEQQTEEITTNTTFLGKYVSLGKTLNFKNKLSYNDWSRKDFGDINGDGNIDDLMTELTTGTGFIPIGKTEGVSTGFQGNFLGNNKKILNIYIDTDSNAGLFGYTRNAKINNIEISGIVKTTSKAGGVVGSYFKTTIENCSNLAIVIGGEYTGGIAGGGTANTITNCYNNGKISGGTFTGGIAGGNGNGTIDFCHNIGEVSGNGRTGGIAGFWVSKITNSYNNGKVTSSNNKIGGILGGNGSNGVPTIINCYNLEDVCTKENNVGGICGEEAYIYNCYNKGKITCEYQNEASIYSFYASGIGNSSENNIVNTYNSGIPISPKGSFAISTNSSLNSFYIYENSLDNITIKDGVTSYLKGNESTILSLLNGYIESNSDDIDTTNWAKWVLDENGDLALDLNNIWNGSEWTNAK